MSLVVTNFSNDESAHPSTLLKTESTTDISIGQVDKFQNGYFKEHLGKAATVLQKACTLKAMEYSHNSILQKVLPLKLTEKMNTSIFVSNFLNFA